ncbi:MAG: hypothetical protein IT376_13625 [Polyangiaceae bacterium]|nr:hypothetical protein [Polyangiaceae bacterium]
MSQALGWKLRVKVPLTAGGELDAHEVGDTFHRWIQQRSVDDVAIYVSDYRHVANGPEVLLVGHATDLVLDRAGGRLGLALQRKRDGAAELVPAVHDALRRLYGGAARLAESLGKPLTLFASGELELRLTDRLRAPNDPATAERLLPELRRALEPLWAGRSFSLERAGGDAEPFGARATCAAAPAIAEVVAAAARL